MSAPESRLTNALTALAAIALALLATAYTSLNTDLGWILDFGRQAQHLGHLPMTNVRSFIEPDHPLVLHEWLMCLLIYFAHIHWGAVGTIGLRWLFVAGTVGTVTATIQRTTTAPFARLATALLAGWTLAGGLQLVRPQLASLLMLALVVHLGLYGSRRALWWALPLFVLWVNLHGGWLAGGPAFAAACVARAFEQRFGWRPREVPTWMLLAVPALTALCLLPNPWGIHLLIHTLHHASDDVRLWNQEWRPPWHAGPLLPYERDALLAMAGAVVLCLATVSPKRLALWALLIFGVAGGLSADRNIRIAPLLILPAVAAGLGRLEAGLGERIGALLRRWTPIVTGAALLAFATPLVIGGRRLFQFIDYPPPNPGTALWVMRHNHLSGRLWSDFNWGGTILWALPDVQIACDGRNVAAYSVQTLRASMLFDEIHDPVTTLNDFGADLVLLSRHYARLEKLSPRFTPLYCDDQVCLLSRNPAQIALAQKGLVLPPRPILASELFEAPTPDVQF